MTTLDLLLQEEKKLGRSQVEHACKQYLKLKTHAGVVPTPRRKVPRAWVLAAFDKQKGVCTKCGLSMAWGDISADYTIPLVDGGRHSKNNIRLLHKRCNSAKGANDMVTESKHTGRTIAMMLPSRLGDDDE